MNYTGNEAEMERILIVEDEMITAVNIKKILEEKGYTVCGIAVSGESALAQFEEKKPDIVMLDIILQDDIDGIEVAREIRKTSDIPIIFLTAHTDSGTIQRAKTTYPQGYIPKPITTQQLFSVLEMAKTQFELVQALKRSEEKFRSIFTNSPIGIFLYDANGISIDANPAICTILGVREKHDLIGLSIFAIPGLSGEHAERIRSGESGQVEFSYDLEKVKQLRRYPTVRSGILNLAVSFSPIRKGTDDGTEEITGYLLQIRDITEQVKMQQQAEEQRQHLIQTDKLASLGTLVTGVAHEINNPNQAIMANSSYLKEAWISVLPVLDEYYRDTGDFLIGGIEYSKAREEIPEYLNLLQDCAQRIDNIVKDLKEFGRYDPDSKMRKCDINTVLHRSVTLMSHFIQQTTDRFEIKYGENLPNVRGNPQKLGQVFINLIQNACQALPDKSRGIRITSLYEPEVRNVVVEISDEGSGISAEILSKIRDPFFTTKRAKGTGLGLAVSSTIIEDHSGTLEFLPKQKKGTTVRVVIPELPAERGDE